VLSDREEIKNRLHHATQSKPYQMSTEVANAPFSNCTNTVSRIFHAVGCSISWSHWSSFDHVPFDCVCWTIPWAIDYLNSVSFRRTVIAECCEFGTRPTKIQKREKIYEIFKKIPLLCLHQENIQTMYHHLCLHHLFFMKQPMLLPITHNTWCRLIIFGFHDDRYHQPFLSNTTSYEI
jgi:hypothetical protein